MIGQPAAARHHNGEVLQLAKQALIGYVAKEALSEDHPGRLPCPESPSDAGTPNEGRAGSVCDKSYATNKNIGRLPWRTLGLDKLVDAAGEPLWYATSEDWTSRTGLPPKINLASTGKLSLDGVGNVVAIIVAPGKPVMATPNAAQLAAGCATPTHQARSDRSQNASIAQDPDYTDYLECQNGSSPIDNAFTSAVVANDTNIVFNDQLVYVTDAEILNAIQGPLTDRVQRTVAPLLSQLSASWVRSGTIRPVAANTTPASYRFLPYAFPFAAPETVTRNGLCGAANTREGLMPLAPLATATCPTTWGAFSISGPVGTTSACSTSGGMVTCTVRYYELTATALAQIINWIPNWLAIAPSNITVSITGTATNTALTFRSALKPGDFTVTAPTTPNVSALFNQVPQTSGSVALDVQLVIPAVAGNLCGLIPPIPNFHAMCEVAAGGLAITHTITVSFPATLAEATAGTPAASFVSPPPSAAHYWFIENEWYRYTYYAVAPSTTAAQSGGDLTVAEFPDGTTNNKRFVLALMGPPLSGQVRPSAALTAYLEGANASAGDNAFAYRVFSAPGNDRVAACPFTTGSICN
jgi:hypothetical protein